MTGSGASDFVSERFADERNSTESEASLFDMFGSNVALDTVAASLADRSCDALKLAVTVAVAADARSPSAHVIVLTTLEHDPWVVVIVPQLIVPVAMCTSERTTVRAVHGPLFRTIIVHVAVWPAFSGTFGTQSFVTARSASSPIAASPLSTPNPHTLSNPAVPRSLAVPAIAAVICSGVG